jgi:hypothetical protein
MISTRPLDAQSRSYVRLQSSLQDLKEQAEQLSTRGAQDSCRLSAGEDGLVTGKKAGAVPLPLNLGEFKTALGNIEKSDRWLIDRPLVSIYSDRASQAHIDVVNYGGFIVAPGGAIASRSVNAW